MQESIVFLERIQCRRKKSSRSLSHLLMSFLYVWMFFRPGLCVLTIWASIRDPASIGDRHLLEHGHQNPRRSFETRRLIEVLWYVHLDGCGSGAGA